MRRSPLLIIFFLVFALLQILLACDILSKEPCLEEEKEEIPECEDRIVCQTYVEHNHCELFMESMQRSNFMLFFPLCF